MRIGEGALLRIGYRTKPAFLIIGAQKAGTSALTRYLAGHPQIVAAKSKELRFFAPEWCELWPEHPRHQMLCEGGTDPVESSRKRAWYHRQFPPPHRMPSRSLAFESTPEYFLVPQTPARIHRYRADMKLIVLLREPAERAYAAWNMYSNFGAYRSHIYSPHRETRTFADAVDQELEAIECGIRALDPAYVIRGLYAEQLERYFDVFPATQLLVLNSVELRSNTTAVVDRVLEFLGLPPYRGAQKWPAVHVGTYRRRAPDNFMARLREFYRPHNECLYRLVGQDFGWNVSIPIDPLQSGADATGGPQKHSR
jgi:hypothetical protein